MSEISSIQIELPLVALRGLTVMPDMIIHFDLSRDFSKAAVEHAMTETQQIFLVAQKNPEQDTPTGEDLYQYGTVALIKQITRLPNDIDRVLVEGQYKAKMTETRDNDGYFSAILEQIEDTEGTLDEVEEEALVRSLKDVFETYVKFYPKIGKSLGKYFSEKNKLSFLVNQVAINTPFTYEQKQQLLETTGSFLKETQEHSKNTTDSLKKVKKSFSGMDETVSGATDGVNAAINSGKEFYDQMSEIIDSAFSSNSQSADDVAGTLNTLASRVQKVIDSYTSLKSAIDEINVGNNAQLNALKGSISGKLGETIATQTELRDKLKSTASSLQGAADTAVTDKAELDKLVKSSADSLAGIKTDFEKNVKSSLDELGDSMGDTSSNLNLLMDRLDEGVDGVYDLSTSASADLTQINTALNHSCNLLNTAAEKISNTTGKIGEMQQSGDFSQLEELISGDSNVIGEFLAAPVSLKTNQVYKIENYGSSMAPFYSTLSIWIGGIVLVAMLKTGVSSKCTEGLKKVKPHQEYLGRYLLFLIVGLLQSTLICLGDLLYLGIQCKHPFLFMLAGWFSSIVYVNIIYTLTVSFGDIGKAVSVVLLVMQVAGSGGTFPIEVAPAFFKAVYPLLPFVHSMAALRETIGGMYGMTYWTELGKLGIFLILSLILGLLLRKPVIRMNEAFAEKLEETKIM